MRENCLNCHVPHGSNNDKLLVQTRPMLCQNCHSNTGNMGHELFAGNSLGSVVNGNPTSLGINNTTGQQANVLGTTGLNARFRFQTHDRPLLPELPYADSRQQRSARCALPALI